jgi:signal transduction histidine kinase
MTLKKKMFWIVGGLGIFFSLLFLLANHLTVFHSQTEQKAILARKVASRVLQALETEKKRIGAICFDWAVWDAMYGYVEAPTREFESQSMPAAVIPEFDLNLVIILNRDHREIYHEGYDRLSRRPIRFDPGNPLNSPFWENLVDNFDLPAMRSFVCSSEHGAAIVVTTPILHGDGRGPMNGRLAMGRLVNSEFNARIGAAIQEKTTLLSPEQARTELGAEPERILRRDKLFLKEDRDVLRIFAAFDDPGGQPVFVVRVDADGALFSLQEKASLYFLVSLLLSMLLLGLLIFWLIDRTLLRRLKDISLRTRDIASFEDLSIRIPQERDDEITRLSQNINKMLERLEKESIRHQEMEQRLVMSEKLVATGRLAANIAHEVNNPLFAIANSIAVIKGKLKNAGSDIGEVLPLAEKEIARVRKITRKLLDYGKVNLETFQESDVDTILNTACEVLLLSKQTRDTAIIRSRKNGNLPVFCNPDSLQQVFMNLILNASEAMDGGGEVVIETERKAGACEIHFRDSGPGFPESVRKRIFEPFNTSKETKGAGLGLYISYHIVKRHGGSMFLDEACASGAHLVVSLPLPAGGENAG